MGHQNALRINFEDYRGTFFIAAGSIATQTETFAYIRQNKKLLEIMKADAAKKNFTRVQRQHRKGESVRGQNGINAKIIDAVMLCAVSCPE